MESENQVRKLASAILSVSSNRYEHRATAELEALFKKQLEASEAKGFATLIQIKRIGNDRAEWKTIIAAHVEHLESKEIGDNPELEKVLTLAAYMRDALLDAEPYDLYLFLTTDNPPNIEVCMRLESTEQFCKKYVLRKDQSIGEMLERTFLSGFEEVEVEGIVEDPLDAALKAAGLNLDEQRKWRDAFLSGKIGDDLIDVIFGMEPTNYENE